MPKVRILGPPNRAGIAERNTWYLEGEWCIGVPSIRQLTGDPVGTMCVADNIFLRVRVCDPRPTYYCYVNAEQAEIIDDYWKSL